jgi:hypothetical protein
MKKIYNLLMASAIAVAPLAAEAACGTSSFTVNSHTDLGGGLHRYNVTFCVGSGSNGFNQNTYTWAIRAYGGAQFVNYPANLQSPLTGANYIGDAVSYGADYLVYDYDYNNGSDFNAGWWACYGGGLCSGLGQVCVTFDITLNGAPAALELMGAEGAGVGVAPYGCNGYSHLTTNFNNMSVSLGNDRNVCIVNGQSCTTITPTISGGTPPYTYEWSSSSNVGVISTAASLSVCPTQNMRYYVTVTDATGSVARDEVYITRSASPVANAGTDKIKYTTYGPSCVSLSGSATGGTAPYTYAWSSGASTASASVCPNATTTYTLNVTDSKGCASSDQAVVTVRNISCGNNKVWMCKNNVSSCVNNNQVANKLNNGWVLGQCGSFRMGMEDEELTDAIEGVNTVYPNPANGNVTVAYNFGTDTRVTVQVMDASGRTVSSLTRNLSAVADESYTVDLETSALTPGLYMVAVVAESGESYVHRLMVAH